MTKIELTDLEPVTPDIAVVLVRGIEEYKKQTGKNPDCIQISKRVFDMSTEQVVPIDKNTKGRQFQGIDVEVVEPPYEDDWAMGASKTNELEKAWNELIIAIVRETKLDKLIHWLIEKQGGKKGES